MKWYAVHAVIGFYFKGGIQGKILVNENVLLIHASDHKEAWTKAEEITRKQEGDMRGSLQIDDRAAFMKFVGIRKSTLCVDPDQRPDDGTELTYSELEFANEDDLNRYVHGYEVMACHVEHLRE